MFYFLQKPKPDLSGFLSQSPDYITSTICPQIEAA